MLIFFYSKDKEHNKVSFQTEGHYEENILVFQDKSVSNTKIYLDIKPDRLLFKRKGDVDMILDLVKDKKTTGYYKNELGLEFNFDCVCKELSIKNNRIDMSYTMFLDNEIILDNKIWIIIRENT